MIPVISFTFIINNVVCCFDPNSEGLRKNTKFEKRKCFQLWQQVMSQLGTIGWMVVGWMSVLPFIVVTLRTSRYLVGMSQITTE